MARFPGAGEKSNISFRIDKEDRDYIKKRCTHAGYEDNLSLYIRSIISKHLKDTHKAYEKDVGVDKESIIDKAVEESKQTTQD